MVYSIPFPLSVSLAATALSLVPSIRRRTQVLRVQTTTKPKRFNFAFRIACEFRDDQYVVNGELYSRAITSRLPSEAFAGHVLCVYDSKRNFVILAENVAGEWKYKLKDELCFYSKDAYVMLLNRTLYGNRLDRDPTYFYCSPRR
ncbi:hypothetical protein FS749_011769 [Ceratobasidium sp. UAMH 11750]|nr:hypothetical protein FS749_011769 [Ceratobasidium sp. UAMH 11750]